MKVWIVVLLVIGLLVPCAAQMEISGTPVMTICQEASNSSWKVWNRRLGENPYDPGNFAWGLSYALRAFVGLYNMTGNMMWVDRAVEWADYLVDYSDVNGDGEPAWGNYNSTWGRDAYEYVEFTVHDGVISTPLLELAILIRQHDELSSDPALASRADRYIALVKEIVDRHHRYWTDVTQESGYYWDAPTLSDRMIVNRFAALGISEIMLSDIIGDDEYLTNPRKMAKLIKDNLWYIPENDCYEWSYEIGEMRREDVSHGSIDLEFMIRAYRHGLHFNDTDMRRLVNTYQSQIWQSIRMFDTGIALAVRVDGDIDPDQDYTRLAKNWPMLCVFEPRIIEQHRFALEIYDRKGLPRDRVMAWTLYKILDLEEKLRESGIDVDSLPTFEEDEVMPLIDDLEGRIVEAEDVGGNVTEYRDLLTEIRMELDRYMSSNVSGLVYLLNDASEAVGRVKAETLIAEAEIVVSRAKEMGIDTTRHELFLERARISLEQGLFASVESMCDYPLSLREQIEETSQIVVVLLLLTSAAAIAMGRGSCT